MIVWTSSPLTKSVISKGTAEETESLGDSPQAKFKAFSCPFAATAPAPVTFVCQAVAQSV